MIFTAIFDEASMKEIAMLASPGIFLDPAMQQTEAQIADLIIQKTHDNAMERFVNNSPGGLAESFQKVGLSPFEIEVGSDKPYARRRDLGFDGADSLGRVYHDKPYLYFSDAVNEVESSGEGMGILQTGVQQALGKMGVSF